jgi:hypothetical protein
MFRLKALIFVALGMVSAFAQDPSPSPAVLVWQNVSSRYKNFAEIKPVLVNSSEKSIFLSRIWPHGSAQLERLSEATGDWESGHWSGGCGTVSKATIPIEIKPRAERRIDVYWKLSTDEWDKPKHFEVGSSSEERPIEGTYRFALRYSLEPWTLIHHPASIYTILSPEFVVSGP